MANHDHIFIGTDLKPKEIAEQLAALLGVDISTEGDEVFVGRPPAHGLPGEIGGEVGPNICSFPESPDEEAVIDGYPIMWTIGYTHRTPEVQLAEARVLFTELVAARLWPVLLVQGLDLARAAWHPTLGLREFPPGTTVDSEDRELWGPYRLTYRGPYLRHDPRRPDVQVGPVERVRRWWSGHGVPGKGL